jgi:hypothetical protein
MFFEREGTPAVKEVDEIARKANINVEVCREVGYSRGSSSPMSLCGCFMIIPHQASAKSTEFCNPVSSSSSVALYCSVNAVRAYVSRTLKVSKETPAGRHQGSTILERHIQQADHWQVSDNEATLQGALEIRAQCNRRCYR